MGNEVRPGEGEEGKVSVGAGGITCELERWARNFSGALSLTKVLTVMSPFTLSLGQ